MIAEYGYVRVAAAVPVVRAADFDGNLDSILSLAAAAHAGDCDVVVFPELCLSGYTCADLFQQRVLLDAVQSALEQFLTATADNLCLHVLGLPLQQNGLLFNCAAVTQAGRVLGVVPKTYIPGHNEYYEPRWFAPADARTETDIRVCGTEVPFGGDLLFRDAHVADYCFGVEICEDLWAPIPPSARLALAGATLLLNCSASNDVATKADYRRQLVLQQSAACLAAYVYASAGPGESTTDLVFGGHALVAENGILLAESERYRREQALTVADADLEFLVHERVQNITYGRAVARETGGSRKRPRVVTFETSLAAPRAELHRPVASHPFVPAPGDRRRERCREVFSIQSSGLATRLQHTGLSRAVLGLSGGLDSTLALLVTGEAFACLGLSPTGIHALTMPGFGTTERTRANVEALCRDLEVPLETIDIRPSCRQHFADIGHDGETGDITFENAQARERTQILMDKANMLDALVVGTGDLSELALGWCTYNGDHMSNYAVNSGVPKTLVRFLVEYVAETRATAAVAATLRDILDTPISPELLPPGVDGLIAQKTEAQIGPYELHDFFLYQVVRCGFAPAKVCYLAGLAFAGQYTDAEIRKWLRLFYSRFFAQQFKRSCLPDGPKVGSLTLSPRGDWRMPSDAAGAAWLRHC